MALPKHTAKSKHFLQFSINSSRLMAPLGGLCLTGKIKTIVTSRLSRGKGKCKKTIGCQIIRAEHWLVFGRLGFAQGFSVLRTPEKEALRITHAS